VKDVYRRHPRREPESAFASYLAEAAALFAHPPAPAAPPQRAQDLEVGADFEVLRWFLLPDEAAAELSSEG
jgi:hypothetical protein